MSFHTVLFAVLALVDRSVIFYLVNSFWDNSYPRCDIFLGIGNERISALAANTLILGQFKNDLLGFKVCSYLFSSTVLSGLFRCPCDLFLGRLRLGRIGLLLGFIEHSLKRELTVTDVLALLAFLTEQHFITLDDKLGQMLYAEVFFFNLLFKFGAFFSSFFVCLFQLVIGHKKCSFPRFFGVL